MAPTKSLFRLFIIISISCSAVAMVLDPLTQASLPPELEQFMNYTAGQAGERGIAIVSLAIPLIILAIASAVGLYGFRRWARVLGLIVVGGSLVMDPLLGVVVESGWVALFNDLATLIWGILIALAFWSPISESFISTAAERAPTL